MLQGGLGRVGHHPPLRTHSKYRTHTKYHTRRRYRGWLHRPRPHQAAGTQRAESLRRWLPAALGPCWSQAPANLPQRSHRGSWTGPRNYKRGVGHTSRARTTRAPQLHARTLNPKLDPMAAVSSSIPRVLWVGPRGRASRISERSWREEGSTPPPPPPTPDAAPPVVGRPTPRCNQHIHANVLVIHVRMTEKPAFLLAGGVGGMGAWGNLTATPNKQGHSRVPSKTQGVGAAPPHPAPIATHTMSATLAHGTRLPGGGVQWGAGHVEQG